MANFLAGLFMLIAVIASIRHIYKHSRSYNDDCNYDGDCAHCPYKNKCN